MIVLNPFKTGTHIEDICNQCRPSSDAAKRGVGTGSSLFAHRNFYAKYNKYENIHKKPKIGDGHFQMIRIDKSTTQNGLKIS